MEQILYNQSLKAPTISIFQGMVFLRVLIFSIFQQLLYNPILQLFDTKVPVVGLDSNALFKSDWSEHQSYISINQDSINVTKYTFILLFTVFRMVTYIIYKLSDQDCQCAVLWIFAVSGGVKIEVQTERGIFLSVKFI